MLLFDDRMLLTSSSICKRSISLRSLPPRSWRDSAEFFLGGDFDHDCADPRHDSRLILNGKVVHHPVSGFVFCGQYSGDIEVLHRLARGKHTLRMTGFDGVREISPRISRAVLPKCSGSRNAMDFCERVVDGK